MIIDNHLVVHRVSSALGLGESDDTMTASIPKPEKSLDVGAIDATGA